MTLRRDGRARVAAIPVGSRSIVQSDAPWTVALKEELRFQLAGLTMPSGPTRLATSGSRIEPHGGVQMVFEMLKVNTEEGVLFAKIAAPPMNLLGPELVRDLVALIQRAEADAAIKVLVFKSADPDY